MTQVTGGPNATRALTGQVVLGGAGFSIYDDRDDAGAIATIRAAADHGIRLFDSARAYATVDDPTHSERLFAEALHGCDDALIMTKGGHFRTGYREWAVDDSPGRLRADVDVSLATLGVERIGMYFLHRADAGDSVAGSIATLEELRREGKIAAIGISNASASQLGEAMSIAPIAAVQNKHTIGQDSWQLPSLCADLGIAFLAYSPLGGPGESSRLLARFPALAALAAARGQSPQRLLLRALLAGAPSMSVVVGARRPATAIDSAKVPSDPWGDVERAAYDQDISSSTD